MTTSPPYDETARRMLASEATASDTQDHRIAAAERVLQRLQEHLLRWFGPDGIHTLLSRALATARAEHPVLARVRIEPRREPRLTELAASGNDYGPEELDDALTGLIAETLALLSRLIGDDLVARLLAGDITVESAPGRGSTFLLVLPLNYPIGATGEG